MLVQLTPCLGPLRLALFGLAVALSACASMGPGPVVPISQVIDASESNPPDVVISQIRGSRTVYAPRGSDYGKLAALGVQPAVLDYLQQSFVGLVDLLTRYWVLGTYLGHCGPCYPQSLDLSSLARGGNGMALDQPTGDYNAGRPPGVPHWIPYPNNTAFSRRRITLDQIYQKARQGVPTDQLVSAIRSSQIENVIGTGGGFNVGTDIRAGIAGSQFAQWHKDGLADPVLDAIQDQYLAQYIEFSRLHWQAIGNGPGGSLS